MIQKIYLHAKVYTKWTTHTNINVTSVYGIISLQEATTNSHKAAGTHQIIMVTHQQLLLLLFHLIVVWLTGNITWICCMHASCNRRGIGSNSDDIPILLDHLYTWHAEVYRKSSTKFTNSRSSSCCFHTVWVNRYREDRVSTHYVFASMQPLNAV